MLSARLEAIVRMVPKTRTVADIGCDHGKVAIWLVKNGRAESAICGDLSARSLGKARALADAEGVAHSVSLREGSGFAVIAAGEAQAAVLAGMGGELMARLLAEGGGKVPEILVLSCNRRAGALRGWLCGAGFKIEDEELVLENGIFYPVIRARRGEARQLSGVEREFGPVLLQKKHRLLGRLVAQRIDKTKAILCALDKTGTPRARALREETGERLKAYEEVFKCL